ncbi:hypothetical protein [Burkholderia sp. JKS000303]|uniref:hypothetical protein n=1 Tax=Burkholderia sp. JKS000303 TaxID=1938747 RepID=UPI000C014426|nr:hypothetical protein [Burkholderia sp. JKS000303]PFH20916.1 hypothetical protein BX604_5338 [Burkholderia sp. JKS000303]
MKHYLSARILSVVLEASSSPAAHALLHETARIARVVTPARCTHLPLAFAKQPAEVRYG